MANGSIDALTQDLRSALRRLRRAPGLSALVVLSLALGIAVSLIATWVPARRASRVDPILVLRNE